MICAALAGRCLLDLGVRGKIMCGKNPKRRAGSVMAFFWNLIRSLMRMAVGIVVLFCAAAIPAYFVSTDSKTLSAAGEGTQTPKALARLYFDAVKLSAASLLAESGGGDAVLENSINALYAEHPRWKAAGGDEPFFDAFYSTLDVSDPAKLGGASVYALLSTQDNREKLLNFLRQSKSAIVARILALRSINSTLLPPVFTSAGAPLDAAILTTALLAQTGDLDQRFLRDFNDIVERAGGDSAKREELERFFIAVLVFSKDCDWMQLRSAMQNFSSPKQAYEFSKVYSETAAACGEGSQRAKSVMLAGLLMSADPDACGAYLSGGNEKTVFDFARAYCNGEGALKFLLERKLPLRSDDVWFEKVAGPYLWKLEAEFAPLCAAYPVGMLVAKVLLALLGGYFFVRGLFRIFEVRRDTPSWISPLALVRGLLEGAVAALFFFLVLEPEAFSIKIESDSPPDLRFSFEKTLNTIGEETMKLDTDTATLAAVGLFLVLQLLVYVFCLIRLASIKRLTASPELKLKLLENEENLFDLGLYIGLFGTVTSLVLLTVGVVTASLMAAYTSTLFGIIVTAFVKIAHVRRYKRRLLMEL